jgi:hypothetical protein
MATIDIDGEQLIIDVSARSMISPAPRRETNSA